MGYWSGCHGNHDLNFKSGQKIGKSNISFFPVFALREECITFVLWGGTGPQYVMRVRV